MTWINLILGLISVARSLTSYLHDKKMIDAGAKAEIVRQFEASSKELAGIAAAHNEADAAHAKDKTDDAFSKKHWRD